MGNRARRRAWAHRQLSNTRLTEFDRQLALAVAGIDRRGIVFCQMDGEFFFEPRPQYAATLAAA
jgi:hypothetical protein